MYTYLEIGIDKKFNSTITNFAIFLSILPQKLYINLFIFNVISS